MMILRSSQASPFGRKVKIAAKMLGLIGDIEIVKADTRDPNDSLKDQNPLGKIPTLILEDGQILYDSRVICEYLDDRAGGGLLFPKGAGRWQAFKLQAETDGILEAAILQVYESRFRPEEKRHQPWVNRQQEKVERALADLERNPPGLSGSPHIGHVTLACALGYLDFRFDGAWRASNRDLVHWLSDFERQVPAFAETMPGD